LKEKVHRTKNQVQHHYSIVLRDSNQTKPNQDLLGNKNQIKKAKPSMMND